MRAHGENHLIEQAVPIVARHLSTSRQVQPRVCHPRFFALGYIIQTRSREHGSRATSSGAGGRDGAGGNAGAAAADAGAANM